MNLVLTTALGLSLLGFVFGLRRASSSEATAPAREATSPGLVRALGWGATIGWAGGFGAAIENVLAHGYLTSGLWQLALEVGRLDVLSTAAIPLAAAAVAWGLAHPHPRLGAWRALTIWLAPPAALAAVLARQAWPFGIATARRVAEQGLAAKVAMAVATPLAAGFLGALIATAWRWRRRRRPRLLPTRRTLCAGVMLGLTLVGALELAHRRGQAMAPAGPNVVLIVVDTLRADFLGCYGHSAPTSPRLDQLAASGIRFTDALAQSPWTLPSVATILTSLYPSQHRANSVRSRLRREFDTLPEILRDSGYRTLGVVSHDFVDRRHGFAQGFADFDDRHVLGHGGVTSERVTRGALAMLEERSAEPFFLFAHYFDPHSRYVRHPGFDPAGHGHPELRPAVEVEILHRLAREGEITETQIEYFRNAYSAEVAFTDHWIGKLIDGVRQVAGDRPTVFIVTADHGEAFHERGTIGHGYDVYRELVRVPLILGGDVDQELRGRVLDQTVETAAIPATVLGLAGLDAGGMRGPNLLQLARGRARAVPAFTEGSYAWGDDRRKLAIAFGGWKLIRHFDDRRLELYDTRSDSSERVDLIASTDRSVTAARGRLLDLLDRQERRLRGPSTDPTATDRSRTLGAEEIERLRSLGYLE